MKQEELRVLQDLRKIEAHASNEEKKSHLCSVEFSVWKNHFDTFNRQICFNQCHNFSINAYYIFPGH